MRVPYQEVDPPPPFLQSWPCCLLWNTYYVLRGTDLYSLSFAAILGERWHFPDLETEAWPGAGSLRAEMSFTKSRLASPEPVTLCLLSPAGVLLAVGVGVVYTEVRFASLLWAK